MEKVTGVGGVFIRAHDKEKLQKWYADNLGVDAGEWGRTFKWSEDDPKTGMTVWNIFKNDTDYYAPSESRFMINYRVRDLDAMLKQLADNGIDMVGEPQSEVYGKFAWILDPEGNKIELWEPPAEVPEGF